MSVQVAHESPALVPDTKPLRNVNGLVHYTIPCLHSRGLPLKPAFSMAGSRGCGRGESYASGPSGLVFRFTLWWFFPSCSYAGHGAGARFVDTILRVDCRAVALLFGCSSAVLAVQGNLEGTGAVLRFLMAGW